jgi:hypothetical protein
MAWLPFAQYVAVQAYHRFVHDEFDQYTPTKDESRPRTPGATDMIGVNVAVHFCRWARYNEEDPERRAIVLDTLFGHTHHVRNADFVSRLRGVVVDQCNFLEELPATLAPYLSMENAVVALHI